MILLSKLTLEDAAYEFVLESRQGGADHARHEDGPKVVSKMIESFVVTPEKCEAMGIPQGVLPEGAWWTGFHIDDAETWSEVKKGRYKMFSIHGSGVREMVEKDEIAKAGFRRLSPKELAQRKAAAKASAAKRRKNAGNETAYMSGVRGRDRDRRQKAAERDMSARLDRGEDVQRAHVASRAKYKMTVQGRKVTMEDARNTPTWKETTSAIGAGKKPPKVSATPGLKPPKKKTGPVRSESSNAKKRSAYLGAKKKAFRSEQKKGYTSSDGEHFPSKAAYMRKMRQRMAYQDMSPKPKNPGLFGR